MEALVVCANPTVRAYLEVALEMEGYHTTSFSDTNEALRYLKEHTPDLIVLDDESEGELSAMDLAWRIKRVRRLKHIPVVVLTSTSDERTKIAARMAKVDKLIIKPLKGGEFRDFARHTREIHSRHE